MRIVMLPIKPAKSGCILEVQLTPNASREEINGFHEGMLKVKVTVHPHEGAANVACVKLLTKALNLKRSQVEIIAGLKSRKKTLLFKDIAEKTLKEKIIKKLVLKIGVQIRRIHNFCRKSKEKRATFID